MAPPLPAGHVRRRKVGHPTGTIRQYRSDWNTPAFVRNGRLDVLAVNPLGQGLYAPVFGDNEQLRLWPAPGAAVPR